MKLTSQKYYEILTPGMLKLAHTFEDQGFALRIVGGSVRDLLLDKKPKDIDLATDALPEQVIEIAKKLNYTYIPTGLQHGTVTVMLDKVPLEITTLRTDVETTGRHATVQFIKDWKADAQRRDLTFNAMSLDFDGNLYDYFNGVNDLRKNIVRFVGNPAQRIQEDYLRILRYFRFFARFGQNQIDQQTQDSIKELASGLKSISGERIWSEIKGILSNPRSSQTLQFMKDLGVCQQIELPCENLSKVEQVSKLTNDPITILACLLDTAKQVDFMVNKLKLSNQEQKMLDFLVKNKDQILDQKELKQKLVDGTNKSFLRELIFMQNQTNLLNILDTWQIPTFPITGNDLMAIGIKQGPRLGDTLRWLKDEWAKSNYVLSKDQLLDKIGKNHGS